MDKKVEQQAEKEASEKKSRGKIRGEEKELLAKQIETALELRKVLAVLSHPAVTHNSG